MQLDIRDIGSIPESGKFPGEGHGNPLQYSCLENLIDRGAWQASVHGVTKSGTRLSDFHFIYIYMKKCLIKNIDICINKKYTKVNIYVPFQYLSIISYYKILSIVPCAIQ